MVSVRARREQVDYAVGRGASVRRSCARLQVSRSALGYVGTMPARDAELADELSGSRRRTPATVIGSPGRCCTRRRR